MSSVVFAQAERSMESLMLYGGFRLVREMVVMASVKMSAYVCVGTNGNGKSWGVVRYGWVGSQDPKTDGGLAVGVTLEAAAMEWRWMTSQHSQNQ